VLMDARGYSILTAVLAMVFVDGSGGDLNDANTV
jgi:hypothetical protein